MGTLAKSSIATGHHAPDIDLDSRSLFGVAAVAAAVSAVLIPLQVAIFATNPYPDSATGWLQLVADRPLVGLVNLDGLLVVDNLLLVPIILAIWFILKATSSVAATFAAALSFLSICLMVASNPAIEILQLSDRFSATTGADQAAIVGAAEAALGRWEGTSFQVAYVLGQIAGIMLGVLLLKKAILGKAVPIAMIVGNVIGFAYYLPKIGLALSAVSGIVLWVWYVLIARRLWLLPRGR